MLDFVQRIEKFRDERHWTNYRLAQEAELSPSTLSGILAKNKDITLSSIEKFCRAFHISITQFFMEEGDAVLLNRRQTKALNAWDALTEDNQRLVLQLMKNLSQATASQEQK